MSDKKSLPQITDNPRDLVGDLLRIADSGPEIPADGADRIKAAIKPLWRRELRARGRRRWAWAVAGVAASAVLAVALVSIDRAGPSSTIIPTGPVAMFDVLHGQVEIISADGSMTVLSELDQDAPIVAMRWTTGQLDQASEADHAGSVKAGSRIRTDGSSRASLRLEGGQSLRLDANTTIQLASAEFAELESGASYVDSEAASSLSVQIHTPFGTAREIGTQFEVRLTDASLSVAVREGSVSITSDVVDLEIQHGAAATINADGQVDRRGIAPSASYWDWVTEIAPPFDIEGRTVASFLEWVSRETGSRIQYSSSEVEDFAHETLLHGTAAGLSPTQAPEVILASCGLVAENKADLLVVQRVDARPGGQ